ncbi:unnamed protein product [Choristocarpus tenellus]
MEGNISSAPSGAKISDTSTRLAYTTPNHPLQYSNDASDSGLTLCHSNAPCTFFPCLSMFQSRIQGGSSTGMQGIERGGMPLEQESIEDATRSPCCLAPRKLFGGAMECLLPTSFLDVSNIRQVPDNQEVFVSRDGDISLMVELLSLEPDLTEGQSASFFFDDLAKVNEAVSSHRDFCGDLTESIMPKLKSFPKSALVGRQTITKHRSDGSPHDVLIYLVNVRLLKAETDLLISVNTPCHQELSEKCGDDTYIKIFSGGTGFDVEAAGPRPGVGKEADEVEQLVNLFPEFLRSFNILDWSLFC